MGLADQIAAGEEVSETVWWLQRYSHFFHGDTSPGVMVLE